MELYLQKKKCILASSNPCNKNKVCPKFLSYGILSMSWKNSAQPLGREVQICLPLFTTFFALKISYWEYYLCLKVSFQETKNSSQDRQHLKLIKLKIRGKTGHLAFTGKKNWKSKHSYKCNEPRGTQRPIFGAILEWVAEAFQEEACSKTRLQSPWDGSGFHLMPLIHIFIYGRKLEGFKCVSLPVCSLGRTSI